MVNSISQLVYTKDNCIGCNRCIGVCPCPGANTATIDENGRNHISVNLDRCIGCGACIDACEHNARGFADDMGRFFMDLSTGKPISVLVAPSFKANYPDDYEKMLGQLKAMGVNRIISVAFGADITTWAYIKYIGENDFLGGISQPCPAVVGYIEKYVPELIPVLMPIHSPLMCTAIYAKKYLGITDSLAFISPCIAKKNEIDDPNCEGYVEYNVTFDHLAKYLREYPGATVPVSDEIEYGLGSIYPMPGGLKDNAQWLLGDDAFIRQLDGEKRLYQYFKTNREMLAKGQSEYLFLDALNCSGGCLGGTACEGSVIDNENAFLAIKRIKDAVKVERNNTPWSMYSKPAERLVALNQNFQNLDLKDFIRKYTDKSAKTGYLVPTPEQEDAIFFAMKKDVPEKRAINCSGCGYDTCKDMVAAIYNGFNHKENCVHYMKDLAEELAEDLAVELREKAYKSTHDRITGVYNSDEFFKQVKVELQSNPHKKYCIVAMDIRQFKLINDIYGFDEGNLVLIKQARLLREEFLGKAIFGRTGADRFGLCMQQEDFDDTRLLRLIENVEHGIAEQGINGYLQAGVCFVEDNFLEPTALYDRAALAIRTIKSSYTQKIAFFHEEMRKDTIRSQRMVGEFNEAIANGQFQIYIQPQFDVDDESVHGGEALVRWLHPTKGVVAPGYFISTFEECGLISTLDMYVWRLACDKLRDWKQRGEENTYISVNISPYDLHAMDIYDAMTKLVEEYDISPRNLKLEITETAVMTDVERQLATIEKLKDYGFTVEMDDFGSGYSSLNMLKDINVNTLKIDMMFLGKTENTEKSNKIIETIITLSKALGMSVVVEGVETKEQVDFLMDSGCDTFQGYYFARPMPVDEFEEKYISFK